jgi:hypothetical protein
MSRQHARMLPAGFGEDGDKGFDPAAGATGMKQRFRWRFNRLRCMTLPEISHRVVRALAMQVERTGLLGSPKVPPPDLARITNHWIHAAANIVAAPYLAAADRIVAGRLDVFALSDADLGSPPHWNRDPKTGVEAPLSFGKLLDYRDPRMVGDIKYLWEPNRHLHLVTLAQAYTLSRDATYFHVLRQHLESWFAVCPFRMGPNWTSALEAGIRLINWSVAWQLLGGTHSPLFQGIQGARLRQRWLDSVHQHAQFVRGHLSLHSSANNHLIGEAAGLFIAALTWPHWPDSRAWLTQAKDILEREALLQVAPDGVSREQSVSYQQFVLDLLLFALLAGKASGQWFSVAYESRIETTDWSSGWPKAATSRPAGRCSRPEQCCLAAAISSSRRAPSTTRRAGSWVRRRTRCSTGCPRRRPGYPCARPFPRAATTFSAATSRGRTKSG